MPESAAIAPQPLLRFDGVSIHYGAIHAVKGITFEVREGEIVTLIGANGAGKTTTLRSVSGLLKPTKGTISFRGETISGLAPHLIVRRRICQAPEGRGIFLNLTVEDNLDLGAWTVGSKRLYQD